MGEYVEERASSLGEFFGDLNVGKLWRHWQAWRSVKQLATFDDYMLRDLGLRREDVDWASRLPISCNAVLALEDRGLRRGRQSLGDAAQWQVPVNGFTPRGPVQKVSARIVSEPA